MPFTIKDVSDHNNKAAADPALAKKWLEIANAVYSDCMKMEGSSDGECAGTAVRVANSKV